MRSTQAREELSFVGTSKCVLISINSAVSVFWGLAYRSCYYNLFLTMRTVRELYRLDLRLKGCQESINSEFQERMFELSRTGSLLWNLPIKSQYQMGLLFVNVNRQFIFEDVLQDSLEGFKGTEDQLVEQLLLAKQELERTLSVQEKQKSALSQIWGNFKSIFKREKKTRSKDYKLEDQHTKMARLSD